MANKITILSEQELNYLLSATAKSLPINPSEQGWSADRVKKAFYKGFEVLFNYLKNTQQETQNYINEIYIESLEELDNYTKFGIYRFNLKNQEIFHLFVNENGNMVLQDRTSNSGHYQRAKLKGYDWENWKFYRYSENGVTRWESGVAYTQGAIVNHNGYNYISLAPANSWSLTDEKAWLKIDFANYVSKSDLKTINGQSLLGNGDIEIQGGSDDLSDYLKNNDNKPDTNIFAVYNSLNIYGKNYIRGLTVQENSTGIFDDRSSIYLRNNDVSINNKSFNDLYDKVDSLFGGYVSEFIDNTTAYVKNIPANAMKYASVNSLDPSITSLTINNSNFIQLDDLEPTTKSGITYSVKDGVIFIDGTLTSSSAVGFNIPLKTTITVDTYTLINCGDFVSEGEKATYGICFSNGWEMAIQANLYTKKYSKTTTGEGAYLRLYLYNTYTYNNFKLMPMLIKGTLIPNMFYKYKAPATITTSQLSENDNIIEIEPCGTITFNNPSNVAVGSEIEYQLGVVK